MGMEHEARWIAQLIKSRQLYVRENGVKSQLYTLETGSPQGGGCSPQLWSLCIDDLVEVLEKFCAGNPVPGCVAKVICFADDISFCIRGFNPSSCVVMANMLLAIVRRWCRGESIVDVTAEDLEEEVEAARAAALVAAAAAAVAPFSSASSSSSSSPSSSSSSSSTSPEESDEESVEDPPPAAVEDGSWLKMSKLQATWITGGTNHGWVDEWSEPVVFSAELYRVPRSEPIRLLGVTFDTAFHQKPHVEKLLESCDRHMRLLAGMAGIVKAEKLVLLYRGLILSRLLYAVDSWWPHTTKELRDKVEALHYRGCCIITGVNATLHPHRQSVVREAGFREFADIAREEMIKVADRLRRVQDGKPRLEVHNCDGVQWVARLLRDGRMPTATLRDTVTAAGGVSQHEQYTYFPVANQVKRKKGDEAMTLREVAHTWLEKVDDRGVHILDAHQQLRPLPLPHPFQPHELGIFDKHVKWIVASPGGLVKPAMPVMEWDEETLDKFRDANARRMDDLQKDNGSAIWTFTDGARKEGAGERCAGAYIISRLRDPTVESIIASGPSLAGRLACAYSAEVGTIDDVLEYVLDNFEEIFAGKQRKELVLVTDSKSSLESMRTTWLRKIQQREQRACRHLHDLAARDVFVTLAFVFSHVGGCEGNAMADKLAEEMCEEHGTECPKQGMWHIDTTRRSHREFRSSSDSIYTEENSDKFRCRHFPVDRHNDGTVPPSRLLPRGMSRKSETLLYRARAGIFLPTGGVLAGERAPCPFCNTANVMARDGVGLEHLECCAVLRSIVDDKERLRMEDLWADPIGAARRLAEVSRLAQGTVLGAQIRNTYATRANRN
jgi:ribonuclease HI